MLNKDLSLEYLQAIFDLVKNIYAAPNQVPTIYEMQEVDTNSFVLIWIRVFIDLMHSFMQHTIDGKNYWTFEYNLESEAFARTAFATIAIGNGMYFESSS